MFFSQTPAWVEFFTSCNIMENSSVQQWSPHSTKFFCFLYLLEELGHGNNGIKTIEEVKKVKNSFLANRCNRSLQISFRINGHAVGKERNGHAVGKNSNW
jgi:hypothetical protein